MAPIRRLISFAATAAIFVIGFGLGRLSQEPALGEGAVSPAIAEKIARPVEPDTSPAEAEDSQPEPAVAEKKPEAPEQPEPERVKPSTAKTFPETKIATLPAARRTRHEDGKIVMETTLAASGGQVLLVIDPSFRLAAGTNGL